LLYYITCKELLFTNITARAIYAGEIMKETESKMGYLMGLFGLFCLGYLISNYTLRILLILIGTSLIWQKICFVLSHYRKINIATEPEKKAIFKKAMVKFFLALSVLSIYPMVLIGINLLYIRIFHKEVIPMADNFIILALFFIFDTYQRYIEPLPTINKKDAEQFKKHLEPCEDVRIPNPGSVKIFDFFILMLLVICSAIACCVFFEDQFIFAVMVAISLFSMLAIGLYHDFQAFPDDDKSVIKRTFLVYILILVLFFVIMIIEIIPLSIRTILCGGIFVGLIIRVIYLFIKQCKYDSQHEYTGEEEFIKIWKSLPPGSEMHCKRHDSRS